jgi:signal transduction histidine kinase
MPDAFLPFLLIGPVLLLLAVGIVGILIREQRRRLAQEQEKQSLLARQNEQLEEQVAARTAEIIAQRNSLEQALLELQTTQTQLVQREKMASLGELTAGIAHEMQNPLNFVTNFSDLSLDLVAELEEELAKENLSAEGKLTIQQLVQDLILNQSRIHQHGHRADRIVKSMLEHSRASSEQRQATDLNALVEESLRLAYHGWRAKSKDSNATLLTELDAGLEPVWVLPQDLNRVLLNLLTNAFYAVAEKSRQLGEAYSPQVCVQTRRVGHTVQIRVRDNGNGIPAAVRDKIFQPFFTTKPTGEGTGLGLSLSYDIVTKGHGGTLLVESQEGEYTEFTIGLPLNTPRPQ